MDDGVLIQCVVVEIVPVQSDEVARVGSGFGLKRFPLLQLLLNEPVVILLLNHTLHRRSARLHVVERVLQVRFRSE